MAKRDVLDEMTEPLVLAMAGSASNASMAAAGGFPPELVELLQRKLMRELKEQDNKEEEMRRLLAARSEAFKEEILARQQAQATCPHRKEDGRPRIGGQRLSDGNILYLCQFCGKEWRGQQLPVSLAVPMDWIGG